MTATIVDWQEYDSKLKGVCSFIENRIKYYYQHKSNSSLLNELNSILFYMETIKLEGHFKKEIEKDIDHFSKIESIKDDQIILDNLKTYAIRIEKNIFSRYFSKEDSNQGLYWVESINKGAYVSYNPINALDLLNYLREKELDFEVYDIKENLINIDKCIYFIRDNINKQNFRCRLLKGPCALAHNSQKEECPNLEDLLYKGNFFDDFINRRYTTIDKENG
jgi:hypothetical protein